MFENIVTWLKEKNRARKENKRLAESKKLTEEAEQMLDVSVHDGAMWLVYNGNLICPMGMFEEKTPSVVIDVLRSAYIENNE